MTVSDLAVDRDSGKADLAQNAGCIKSFGLCPSVVQLNLLPESGLNPLFHQQSHAAAQEPELHISNGSLVWQPATIFKTGLADRKSRSWKLLGYTFGACSPLLISYT